MAPARGRAAAKRDEPLVLRIVGCLSAELVSAFEVDRASTVLAAKVELERLEGTPWEGQRLLFQGRSLLDREVLGQLVSAGVGEAEVLLVRLDPARTAALRGLREGRVELEDLDEELRKDRDVVLTAVQYDGHALMHAAPELRTDRAIVIEAVTETGMALKHAEAKARDDREVVLAAVRMHGEALQHASDALRADPEVVLSALRARHRDENTMRYAADSLKDDRDFMFSAVHEAAMSIRHASERLKQDPGLIASAVKGYPEALFAAGERLQSDREFVLSLVRINGVVIAHAVPEVREDAHVLAAAMENTPEALAWLRRLAPSVRNRLIRNAQAVLQGE